MKTIYQSYWPGRKKIQCEEHTISYLDTSNKTKYEKKYLKGEITTEEVAKKNHKDRLHYEFTMVDEEGYPICYVTIVPENDHVGVNFIDGDGRKYLAYLFDEIEPAKKLFLKEVWFWQYAKATTDEELFRKHFVFDQEGNVNSRKYIDREQRYEDYEGKIENTSMFYENYPEFGKYDSLTREERGIPFG